MTAETASQSLARLEALGDDNVILADLGPLDKAAIRWAVDVVKLARLLRQGLSMRGL